MFSKTSKIRSTARLFQWSRDFIRKQVPTGRQCVDLQPESDLIALPDGSFKVMGAAPLLALLPGRRRFPMGWALIRYKIDQADRPLHATLVLRSADQPDHPTNLILPVADSGTVDKILPFPAGIDALYLKISMSEGSFRISNVSITPLGRIGVGLLLLRRHHRKLDRVWHFLRLNGWSATLRLIRSRLNGPRRAGHGTDYATWVRQYDGNSPPELAAMRDLIGRLPIRPLISIVMPAWNSDETFLKEAIDSVLQQVYPHWELCIADDASTTPHVRSLLEDYRQRDPRIRVVHRPFNGHIAAASNSALELVTGDYVALLDHDDRLPPSALYHVAVEIGRYPDADLIYSDEDKIDEWGNRYDPHFKPDWSPELFCAQNYISHLGVYRTALVRAVGGFRTGYEGSQDYDLALRVIARSAPSRIRHILRILYHWRVFSTSGSFSTDYLDQAVRSARRALADHFAECGEKVEIGAGHWSYHRVRRPLPDPAPPVTLIVPTRDRLELVRECVEGLLHRTHYSDLDVIIVDNDSTDAATLAWFASLAGNPRVKVLPWSGPFNFSAINNAGVTAARGTVVGLINNDLSVIHPDWLTEMVVQAIRPSVGAVGAKLLYGNRTIQHGGVILGIGGVAGHSHKYVPAEEPGYFSRLMVPQNLSAVTAACMVLRKECYLGVGGLDEINLKVAFNDVDLCLRLRKAGYDIVWTPYAELYHLESVSRGTDTAPDKAERFRREVLYMQERWGDTLRHDPFYSPNLTLDSEDFSFSWPPRVERVG
jgi:O-antigen biosynthesis protein